MKTKELIKQLQELDPEGICEVFGDGDIYCLEKLPWYYDGKPGILIRDESKKPYYDIIGMRQITPADGDKIYLKCMDLEQLAMDESAGFNPNIIEGSYEFKQIYKGYLDKWNKWLGDTNTTEEFSSKKAIDSNP